MANGVLSIWTIYDQPRDVPGQYVARRWEVVPHERDPVATEDTIQSSDLDMVRRSLQLRGLTCLARSPKDDPAILESWL